MLMFRPNAHSSKGRAEKKFLQRQVKTAIRKSSNWGDFLKTLEQMYPVYDTDLSVGTEIEEILLSPNSPQLPISQSLCRSWKSSWGI